MLNDDEVRERVIKFLADLQEENGIVDTRIADACLAIGLQVAERSCGPLAVARRLYCWSLAFAKQAGLTPEGLHKTKH